mgnify:CR=1 FL=1
MNKLKLHLFLLALIFAAALANTAQAQLTFDRPKTEPPLDNPYNINLPREKILEGVREPPPVSERPAGFTLSPDYAQHWS